jgi:hypothetical protein
MSTTNNVLAAIEAATTYKAGSPLRSNSKNYKDDLAAIRTASRPVDKALKLVAQRREARIVAKVDGMLADLQGKRKRYAYNQTAAIGLKELWAGPLDPTTQLPIWRELLESTKGTQVTRKVFLTAAFAILSQHSLYDPRTMAA